MSRPLDELLGGLCDGTLDVQGRESLGALIATDPEARRRYLEYLDLHVSLSGPAGVTLPEAISEPARPRHFTRRFGIASALTFAALGILGLWIWIVQPRRELAVAPAPAGWPHLVEFGGRATVSDAAGTSVEAREGYVVQPGQTLRTDAGDGYAVLDFGNGSWLQLSPEARLGFAGQEPSGGIRVVLSAGVLRGDVKATDRLTVVTPLAEFHPADARFLISANAPNVMETESKLASVLEPSATLNTFADWGLAFSAETSLVARLKSAQYSILTPDGGNASTPRPGIAPDVLAAGLSGDGGTFFRVAKSGTLTLWDTATSEERLRIEVGAIAARWPWAIAHDGSVLAAAHVISGPAIEVRLWNARSGTQLKTGKPTATPCCVAVSADGKWAAWGIDGRKKQPHLLEIWDVANAKTVSTATVPEKALRTLAFAPDGRSIAGATEAGTVHVWDCATGRMQATLLPAGSNVRPVSSLSYSRSGKLLAAGRADGCVEVWDASSGRERLSIQPGSRSVTALAFSPSDRALAVGLLRQPTTVWAVPHDHD